MLVSAWAEANRLVLGPGGGGPGLQRDPGDPGLAAAAWPWTGCVVTVDAIGCQTAIAAQIVAQGADYVLALKENQPTLQEAVAILLCRRARPTALRAGHHDTRRTVEKGHGRLEVRQVWTVDDPAVHRLSRSAWRVAEPAQRRPWSSPNAGSGRSLPRDPLLPEQPAGRCRDRRARRCAAHWGIENRLHWVLDIAFREDESRVRQGHADQNLAVLRRFALNLLRQEPTAKIGIKAKRLKAGWDHAYLLKILAG